MKFSLNIFVPVSLACLVALPFGAGPVRAQGTRAAAQSVTIINTGVGRVPGYRIIVSPDGHIQAIMQPRHRDKPIVRTDQMTALNRQAFFRDLRKVGALNALPVGTGRGTTGNRRGQRTQFRPSGAAGYLPGPQVYVLYRGQQTPNLRAAGSSTGKVLYEDVTKIMAVLRMPIPDYP